MSTSKKITSKAVKSPAPATKSVASSPTARKATATVQPTPARPAPKPAAATMAKTSAARPAVAAAAAPSPLAPAAATLTAPAPKAVAAKPVVTTITARVDVGFGNALFIRGEGPGLSWHQGVPMECVGSDLWQIALGESARAFTFKFLINDSTWSTGDDYTAPTGSSYTFTPQF